MRIEEWLGEDNKLGIDIWRKKYQYNGETFDQWLDRVSAGDENVKTLIKEKKFLFGGRILANRGLDKHDVKITYSNCYVLNKPDDSLESIFDTAKKLARTYSYGGGVGIDLSNLAPRGARVHNTAKNTTGAVSFMDLYSLVTGLIGQNGRRGALMLSLSCDHPDLEEFIGVKADLDKVTKANISVRITDEFMKAVKEGKEFELSFTREATRETIKKTVDARKIFHKFAEMNWRTGEPGMLFWDTVERYNLLNTNSEFQYAGVNPCAEEPLPAGGSCLLGSVNLAEFVKNKRFDFNDFFDAVQIAVKALNQVLMEGMPLHPLTEQQKSVNDWRQIGLGIFGLADALIKMEIPYGSKEAVAMCNNIGYSMAAYAIHASAMVAKEQGSYPKFNIDEVMNSMFYKVHSEPEIDELVRQYGLANSQILTIAPTGTLSTMLGVSGGIEPIFANYYTRKTESLHGSDVYYKVYTPIVDRHMKQHNIQDDTNLPNWFVTAGDLDYKARINMQSAWQKHIDASISSTVNLPHEATIEDVENLYMYAWEQKLKGITIFRDGCERAGILTTSAPKEDKQDEKQYDSIVPTSRKTIGVTSGKTYCKKCACGTLYITVNHDDDGNVLETFINTSKGGICQANISAVNRMISTGLRAGVKVEEIVDQLKGITCPACIKVMGKGEKLDGISCSDILARTLLEFYREVKEKDFQKSKAKHDSVQTNDVSMISECPDCGANVIRAGGCVQCTECGWSKCN